MLYQLLLHLIHFQFDHINNMLIHFHHKLYILHLINNCQAYNQDVSQLIHYYKMQLKNQLKYRLYKLLLSRKIHHYIIQHQVMCMMQHQKDMQHNIHYIHLHIQIYKKQLLILNQYILSFQQIYIFSMKNQMLNNNNQTCIHSMMKLDFLKLLFLN